MNKEDLIKIIQESTLHTLVKGTIIKRIGYEEMKGIIDDGCVICDLDACLELYKKLSGKSVYDSKGHEREDVEPTIRKHFKDNLNNFPFDISTEDYVVIYEK